MKWLRLFSIGLLVTAAGAVSVQAQFLSGSDGSDGALSVLDGETITVPLPDDGIFNYTTVTVASGGTLTFNRNVRNTPVHILAQGDILIDGIVQVNGGDATTLSGGIAGPGGFDGGAPGLAGGDPADGHGPGGGTGVSGVAGDAAYGARVPSPTANDGLVYGSPLLVPLVGGSGGGGDTGQGGGGGGGAILLSSTTQVLVNGTIFARGGRRNLFNEGLGSGGGIRIVSPLVGGTGTLNVMGGIGTSGGSPGGAGRIRIDVIDRTQLTLNFSPSTVVTVGGFLAIFPDVITRLDITSVAGNAIPVGAPGPVLFVLPFNSPTMQPVTVTSFGFSGVVPISIVLTPDSGARRVFDTEIDLSVGPAVTLDVDFPANVATRVHAWTR